ncbi:MAG: hypothetical protein A2504_11255 [Bdellovibrionales bacterium RIFOXYD12_FULL_39_22]|nr:MAG: hypothetical protein A2385_09820 [Bdellovibrionales bacterium RIFOXYB1_FULL_39_21]OFZ44249.1 MAG: hypothetical protein A2485_07440 [Bdellovibrionales bacterium RIFOXYC12_FULL_39_17]OFZ46791.1 MAG: hypothetical protein A2404_04675 [Bdellovibrionales bacterium RIFOXYC1_FULL_39_130]OFZ75932.1 MAG: hypothetical protein A2560_02475 [Bdellovibrionales bacterium RIFOXYD1_FULL_39_84]OFZ95470.1 MAG: hypothetical protein A2504_11255 [Bdellovibrionales bacterium RIFOXYD12_FULL_39_22]HLE09792.1 hy
MKQLRSIFVAVTLTLLSLSSSASETITIGEKKRDLRSTQVALEEVEKSIENFQIKEGKAMIEITDGMKNAGIAVVGGTLLIPVGLYAFQATGALDGISTNRSSFKEVVKMIYGNGIGKTYLAVLAAGAGAYLLYKGKDYLTLDMDQLEDLKAKREELEKEIKSLQDDIQDFPNDLEIDQ